MRKLLALSLVLTMAVFFTANTAMADGKDKDKHSQKSKVCFKHKCQRNHGSSEFAPDKRCWDVCVLCVPHREIPHKAGEAKRKVMTVQIGKERCKYLKPGKYCIFVCKAEDWGKVGDHESFSSTPMSRNKKVIYVKGGEDSCWRVCHNSIRECRDRHDNDGHEK